MKDDSETVLCLGPCATLYKGGIAQFFSAFVEELRSHRKVHFLTWRRIYPGFLLKRDFKDSRSKEKLSFKSGDPALDFYNPLTILRVIFIIHRQKARLVILNWAHPVHAIHYLLLLILVKVFAQKTKVVLICHNVLPHESFFGARHLSGAVFRMCNKVIVHSQPELRRASKIVKDSSRLLRLFMPVFDFFGSDTPLPYYSKDNPNLNLLFFGAIRPYKGVDILLRGFSIAHKTLPELRLTIAGEYFYENDRVAIPSLAEELGISSRVVFLNHYIPNERIRDLLADADALVFPFLSITQSASLTLAIGNNKPVIVSKLQPFQELIKEGVHGCLFTTGSPDDLASAMLRFYEYPSMDKNITALRNDLSWQRYIQLLLQEISTD